MPWTFDRMVAGFTGSAGLVIWVYKDKLLLILFNKILARVKPLNKTGKTGKAGKIATIDRYQPMSSSSGCPQEGSSAMTVIEFRGRAKTRHDVVRRLARQLRWGQIDQRQIAKEYSISMSEDVTWCVMDIYSAENEEIEALDREREAEAAILADVETGLTLEEARQRLTFVRD
jgi:hypothetical protein